MRTVVLLTAIVILVVAGVIWFGTTLPMWNLEDTHEKNDRSQQQQVTATHNFHQHQQRHLPKWKPGFLDIHHLHVGSSVSTFIIMPDGTTLLVDAGEINVQQQRQWWKSLGPPYDKLKALDPIPNATKTVAGWIVEYLQEFWPNQSFSNKTNTTTTAASSSRATNKIMMLDYVLLTHFHGDHFGERTTNHMIDGHNYSLTGIPAIAHQIPIQTLIDRGYPDYNIPRDLRFVGDANIDNYLAFVTAFRHTIQFEQFQVGSTRQVKLKYHDAIDDDFQIQIIKNGDRVLVADKDGNSTRIQTINGTILDNQGQWNENTMSAAFVMTYGDFKYYEGGDQEVVYDNNGSIVFDTIGPTARAAGKVDVASLNHHGHGVTEEFVKELDPPVLILQGWCSDQPPTKSVQLLAEPLSTTTSGGRTNDNVVTTRQIFATHVFPERLKDMGPALAKVFASTAGHVVVRVHPKLHARGTNDLGDDSSNSRQNDNGGQIFEIYVLDGNRRIQSYHGHYSIRKEP